jgi:hypothetical protein
MSRVISRKERSSVFFPGVNNTKPLFVTMLEQVESHRTLTTDPLLSSATLPEDEYWSIFTSPEYPVEDRELAGRMLAQSPPPLISFSITKNPASLLTIYEEPASSDGLKCIASELIHRAINSKQTPLPALLEFGLLPICLAVFPRFDVLRFLPFLVGHSDHAANWLLIHDFMTIVPAILDRLPTAPQAMVDLVAAFGFHPRLELLFPTLAFILCDRLADSSNGAVTSALDGLAMLFGKSPGCCRAVVEHDSTFVPQMLQWLPLARPKSVRPALFRLFGSLLRHPTEFPMDFVPVIGVLTDILPTVADGTELVAGVNALTIGCRYGENYVELCSERGVPELLRERFDAFSEWEVTIAIVKCLCALVLHASATVAARIVADNVGLWGILMDNGAAFAANGADVVAVLALVVASPDHFPAVDTRDDALAELLQELARSEKGAIAERASAVLEKLDG